MNLSRWIAVPVAAALLVALGACTNTAPKTGPARWVGEDDIPLIAREDLFRSPSIARLRLSPDGSKVLFTKSDPKAENAVDRLPNLYVAPFSDMSNARRLTSDERRGIRGGSWAFNNRHVLFSQDTDGDESFALYSVDVNTGEVRNLTPGVGGGVSASVAQASRKSPDTVIVSMNDTPNRRASNLYKLDLNTGELTPHMVNNGATLGWIMDDEYNIRFQVTFSPRLTLLIHAVSKDGTPRLFMEIKSEDIYTTNFLGFGKDNTRGYAIRSEGRNTGALYEVDTETGEVAQLFAHDKADISAVALDPDERTPVRAVAEYLKPEHLVFTREMYEEFTAIEKLSRGSFDIVSSTADNRKWLVAFSSDVGSISYWMWDRNTKSGSFVMRIAEHLDELPLAPMHPVVIKARDGLEMVSYLTVPLEAMENARSYKTTRRVPLVLNVHGGPNARDSWGLHPEHQLFANRGYAVLSVNFRASTGFGKNHINAGKLEWGRKMHDDLLDAVEWAVKEGVADPERVAIYGGSYGGYATLWGMTNTPEVFRCGVSVVGPSNLETLLMNAPDSWQLIMPLMFERVGNPYTKEGRELLKERSPIHYVENIQKPLLIGHGQNDPRVKKSESDQIVAAMVAKQIPVTYVNFPDEGHGFARPENNQAFYAITEAFLAEHLGGRAEPFGEIVRNSSAEILEGATGVRGLVQAMKQPEPVAVVTPEPEPEPAPAPVVVEPEPVKPVVVEPEKQPEPEQPARPRGRLFPHGAAGGR